MVQSINKPRISDHGRLILGGAGGASSGTKKGARDSASAQARDSKLVAGGRNAKAGHSTNTGVASEHGVVGLRVNKPAAFVVELPGRELKAERSAEGKWTILGKHAQYDARAAELVGGILKDNPGQLALGIYALASLGEPRRELEELTLTEVRTIAKEVDQALADPSVKGDARRYLKHLKSALSAALRTPDLTAAQKTAALEHPLLGTCVVRMRVADRNFSFGLKDGTLVQRDFGGAENHLMNYLAVQRSDALEPKERAHLLSQIAPKLTVTADGARQIELSKGGYSTWLIRMHPDGRLESKDGKDDWKPTVGPAQALLLLAALDAAEPDQAAALRGRLFRPWTGGKDGKTRYYGGYINKPEQKFLGVSVEGEIYNYGGRNSVAGTKTDFLAGMYRPYRWSEGNWDTSDGASAFSMMAMAEVAKQSGESVLEEIRPVVDFKSRGSGFTLRDMRGESCSYEAQVTDKGGGVGEYSPGYYAPSGYAYEKAGYKEARNAVYGAFIAIHPYVAEELGWGPISSVATIEPKGDEAIVRSAKLRGASERAMAPGPTSRPHPAEKIEPAAGAINADAKVLHKIDFGDVRKIERSAPELLVAVQAAMGSLLEQGQFTSEIQRTLKAALQQARDGTLEPLKQLVPPPAG